MKTSRITDEQVEHWLEHGFVVVPDFLTGAELEAATGNLRRHFPTGEEYVAAPERYRNLSTMIEFPFAGEALNDLCLSPDILDFVEEVLGTGDVLLAQSLLWAKYGGGQFEQFLHRDFGNNSLAVPRDDGRFRQLPMILYYTDVTADHGPTYVVSQRHSGDLPVFPLQLRRESSPEPYAHEQPVTVTAGSLLIYSMRTLHRGSAFHAEAGSRFSHHIVYRAAGLEWMGFRSLPREGNTAEMRHFMEVASPRQRTAIGFPAPGHEYWNDETLAGVAARYPNMDMTPYRQAAPAAFGS